MYYISIIGGVLFLCVFLPMSKNNTNSKNNISNKNIPSSHILLHLEYLCSLSDSFYASGLFYLSMHYNRLIIKYRNKHRHQIQKGDNIISNIDSISNMDTSSSNIDSSNMDTGNINSSNIMPGRRLLRRIQESICKQCYMKTRERGKCEKDK